MEDLAKIFYLAAPALFIFGVKDLAKVRTSRRGNGLAALGMLVAVVTTLVAPEGGIQLDWKWVAGGLILGSLLGALLARTIALNPQT